ncbi:MAG: serine hydrolase [Candidatus Paceibacterota bacterium]|jgi:D-alanyl-D-alanine carboxypeptidase
MRRNYLIALDCICLAIIVLAFTSYIEQNHPAVKNDGNVIQSVDTPLVVSDEFYGEEEYKAQNEISTTPKPTVIPKKPGVTAVAFLVGDVVSGEILISRNMKARLPVASMSKLVTAFAVTDHLPVDTQITITREEASSTLDTSGLMAGENFTVSEFLYPLLLNSSNLAAEALASSSDRSKFLELMSSYAWEVGMPSTFFADPSGLSPQNVSTASDFFALARYLLEYRPDILKITRIPTISLATTSDHGAHEFVSIHPFVNHPDFIGGKTGHTRAAKDTMLTILKVADRTIAIVVLASDDRKSDTQMLLTEVEKLIK